MGNEMTFLGLLVSLGFIELTGVFPGGIIVPSYLVLFASQPARIGGTLLAALLAFLCYRIACQWLILFGRRRLVFLMLVGGLCTLAVSRLAPSVFPAPLELRVIGWVVPGLIANHFERQGVLITTAALVTVTVVIHSLARLTPWLSAIAG